MTMSSGKPKAGGREKLKIACRYDGTLTDKEFYEQGSKFCHQYSELTMKLRMFSQQVLLGYAVAIGVFLANLDRASTETIRQVLWGGGLVLVIFAVVLALLNYHFSSAFRAIRDESLVPLEDHYLQHAPMGAEKPKATWPWQAHKALRDRQWTSSIAWYSPFFALILIATLSIWLGCSQ